MRTDLSPEFARLVAYARAKAISRKHVSGLKPSRRVAKIARTRQHARNRKFHERDMRLSAMMQLNNNLI